MDDIVILAGGECPADLAALSGVLHRADVPYEGRSFLQIAIDAVSHLGEPLVVGGKPNHSCRRVEGGETFVDSLEIATKHAKGERFLLVFADLPFLTSYAVNHFMQLADPTAAVNYPIVPVDLCLEAYPELKRTSVSIKEGAFTGGNLAFLKTEAVRDTLPILRELYEHRKSPLRVARTLGLGALFLLLKAHLSPSTVSIRDFERSIGKVLDLKIKGVIVPEPSIGTDIDSAEQYQALLRLQNPGTPPTT